MQAALVLLTVPADTCPALCRRKFLAGAMLDLVVMSKLYELGVLVLDTRGQCQLCAPKDTWLIIMMDPQMLTFTPLAINTADGNARSITAPSIMQHQLVWDFDTQTMVATLLSSHAHTVKQGEVPQKAIDEDELPCLISPTIPWTAEDLLGAAFAGGLNTQLYIAQILASRDTCNAGEQKEVVEGAGSGGHGKGTPCASAAGNDDDSEDLLPLVELARRRAPNPMQDCESDEEAERPFSIRFFGAFEGGRTNYSHPLTPGDNWAHIQSELNRAVKRRKANWWLFLHDQPIDPLALVPMASLSPFDCIRGTLKKLDAPLDFDSLRQQGRLVAPTGPTHTGVYATPVPTAICLRGTTIQSRNAHARLVSSEYDSTSVSSTIGYSSIAPLAAAADHDSLF
eukprot:2051923-Amphidinium_carterae.2